MKFNIGRPPTEGKDLNEKLTRLTSWLCTLSESLNVVLSSLGEENFSDKAREKLFEKKEVEDDKT